MALLNFELKNQFKMKMIHDQASRNESNSSSVYSANILNKPKPAVSFGKCKVCHDVASGIHYGIATCEGNFNFVKVIVI